MTPERRLTGRMCARHEMLYGEPDPDCPDCQDNQPKTDSNPEYRNTENMDKCPDCGSVDLRPRSYGYWCQRCHERHD